MGSEILAKLDGNEVSVYFTRRVFPGYNPRPGKVGIISQND